MAGDPHPSSTELASLPAREVLARFEAGALRPSDYVAALRERIDAVDRDGPALRAVLALSDEAEEHARQADIRWARGEVVGPLDGLPLLIKDNIDTHDLPTTAGSEAMADDRPARDAVLVRQLRGEGAVILGKANLSEWANFRGFPSISGWSALGGQCRNPHALDRSPVGSSSGSAAGVAAGLAPLAIGTETSGSIVAPAHACGVVGLKPTVGLLSRVGIVPIAQSFDTAGPIGRTVDDVAMLYEILAATRLVPLPSPTVAPTTGPWPDDVGRLLDDACAALADAGVTVGTPTAVDTKALDDSGAVIVVMLHECRHGLDAYLHDRESVSISSIEDLIEFNHEHADTELALFGQEMLEMTVQSGGLDDPAYLDALARCRSLAGPQGIDRAMAAAGADVLLSPTMSLPGPVDEATGPGGWATYGAAAAAGYPSLTVPMGFVDGLPVGCLLVGRPLSEATLLDVASRLERALALDVRPAWRTDTLSGPE